MTDPDLTRYLGRQMSPPDPQVLAAVAAGPIAPGDAVPRADLDRLLDPTPLAAEVGWCTLPDRGSYVAVRTEMPGISAEMVDWWFDWHARDSFRYRIWHPEAHFDNSIDGGGEGAKAHWGATHHPVEDVGTGTVRARIEFVAPTELGFSTDALDDPVVGTIVCGWVGDDSRHVRHSAMAHVFLREGDGLVLRSHFWLGSAIRPYLPAPLAAPLGLLLGNRVVRRIAMPPELPAMLALHCAEEYANLAALLPELHLQFS